MKILIVEDDRASQTYLNDTIEAEGHEVNTAENGQAGLIVFDQFKPDLILSDIRMPVMDGLEMLEEIRHQHKDTIIVMITAYGSEEFAIKSLRLGANNYLKKPVRHSDLLPLIRKYNEIIENRTTGHEIHGMVVRKEFTMTFDNNLERLPKIVDHLVLETRDLFEEDERMGIHLGLTELLMNAVEHGNLGITYDDKSHAMESETLYDLYEERQSDPVLAKRKVTVEFAQNATRCEWMISDEGKGFDWQSLKNPLENVNVLETHGRGIFITRFQFDELEHIGKGNVVRIKKVISYD